MTLFSRVAAAAALTLLVASPAAARSWITLYSAPGYQGTSVELDHPVRNLDHYDFNDRAQSVRVHGAWQLCAANDFEGACVVLNHDVPYLKSYDMNRRANSVRPIR